ncbi:MAG: glycoside hydrolase family 2 TIM barrel-domain containing protein, partial [Verrucomicrobiota bacterium]
MKYLFFSVLAFYIVTSFASGDTIKAAASQSLAGSWNVKLDPKDEGLAQHWFDAAHPFDGSMALPGTTDEAGLGTPAKKLRPLPDTTVLRGLQRKVTYEGPVWFRRSVDIPPDWSGKVVTLELERVLWESRVWLDAQEMGMENSLSTPHRFTLTGCKPGHHELVVRVDNRKQFDIGKSHAYIDDTQTKWNGIVGRLELHADPLVHITTLWLNPDSEHPALRVHLENETDKAVAGTVTISVSGSSVLKPAAVAMPVNAPPGASSIEIPLDKWGPLPKWDEFHPNLSTLQLQLKTSLGEQTRKLTFGLRTIQRDGQILRINGRPLFLRGTHEGCSFPLTGYPPMDVDGWKAVFKTVKRWGLNHVRFHSYCPPEACFTAADEEGVYLQIELPLWVGKIGAAGDDKRADWIHTEAVRILRCYGNHPSILMMSLGNELEGEFSYLEPLVQELQKLDPRRLYTLSSNRLYAHIPANAGKPGGPVLADDFKVERLLNGGLRGQSYFNGEPNTVTQFSGALKGEPLPVITHEVAQWCVFPNMAEITKY